MLSSIPQWITDIESDERIYKNKRFWTFILLISMFIIYVIFNELKFFGNPLTAFSFGIVFLILVSFAFTRIDAQKPNLPNLLAANLYRIGTEFEAFDASSPSYLKRNQQYFKNCHRILNSLMVDDIYFIEDYIKFLKNIDNIILRINYLYSKNSKPNNLSISSDLKSLAESVHENYNNLQPVHTAYVTGILSNLQNIEQQPLNISFINKILKLFSTGWHNRSYFYRATVTFLVIGIIIFSTLSITMIYALEMNKPDSYHDALFGTLPLIAALITQIDKIVPKEKIKFN